MNENLKQFHTRLQSCLNDLDRENAVGYSLMLLSEGKVSITELYEEILSPILNSISIGRGEEDSAIWKEHVMTNIVRTIVECSYPYVIKEKEKNKGEKKVRKVMVLCPEEEYHELGARMGADFYTINGYDVVFIGCNTPKENFISAYNALKPDMISISITNYLNLISLKKIIEEIREKIGYEVKIILSGSAFASTKKTAKDFGAAALVGTFREIEALRRDDDETGI